MQSKLTEERAASAARLVAEGLTLDAAAERLGVHRRTILRWVERDPAFRARYEEARRAAHRRLYDELLSWAGAAGATVPSPRDLARRFRALHGGRVPAPAQFAEMEHMVPCCA